MPLSTKSRVPTKRDAPVDQNSTKSPKNQNEVRQELANREEDY